MILLIVTILISQFQVYYTTIITFRVLWSKAEGKGERKGEGKGERKGETQSRERTREKEIRRIGDDKNQRESQTM